MPSTCVGACEAAGSRHSLLGQQACGPDQSQLSFRWPCRSSLLFICVCPARQSDVVAATWSLLPVQNTWQPVVTIRLDNVRLIEHINLTAVLGLQQQTLQQAMPVFYQQAWHGLDTKLCILLEAAAQESSLLRQ